MWLPITIVVIFILFTLTKALKRALGVVDKAIIAVDAYCDIAVHHAQSTRDNYIACSLDNEELD